MTKIHSFIRSIAIALPSVLAFGGCGDTLPEPSEVTKAGPVVAAALDAWRRGEKADTLLNAATPVRVIDHEWQTGWALDDYKLEGAPVPYGPTIRQPVALELKNPDGKEIKKSVFYLVNTGNPSVITREDLDGD
jgi:hypothetical protein